MGIVFQQSVAHNDQEFTSNTSESPLNYSIVEGESDED